MTDDKLHTSLSANTIMAKVTNHFQRTKLISSTDKHYSLDSTEDFRSACRNVSHQQQVLLQNYRHPDDHTIRTTDTPGFKPFPVTVTGQSISAAYFMKQHDLRPCAQYAEKSSYSKMEISLWKFKNTTMTGHFGFVFEENSVRGAT